MKGWKTVVQLADGRVVSAYDRCTEWGPGRENVVAPPTEICAGLNDSASVGDALSFVNRCSLRPGERLVLIRTGGERGVVVRSPGKRTCERMTSVHAWVCERDEAQRVYEAAVAEAGRVYDAAWAEAGRVYAAAWAEAGWVYKATCDEAWRRRRAACDAAWQVYGAVVRKRVCRKRNKLW